MNEEEQRCFDEAGLMSSIDDDVVAWWDAIAESIREKQDKEKTDIGRKGEYLTLEYEEKRTGVKADWRALETNLAGYDIISQRSSTSQEKILIEVKASTKDIANAVFYISRNEWNMAVQVNNRSRYYFYLWLLINNNWYLAIVDTEEMSQNMPQDNNDGQWETVKVPYNAFSNKFIIV